MAATACVCLHYLNVFFIVAVVVVVFVVIEAVVGGSSAVARYRYFLYYA